MEVGYWKTVKYDEGIYCRRFIRQPGEINVSPTQSLGSTVMPGDIKYRDVNGDGLITEDDMVVLSDYGNIPRIQYGLGVNITYKKFDFGVF